MLIVLLAGGSYLRIANIGKYSFWTDEFFAVYAAKSYMSENSFYVPYEGEHPYRKLVVYITGYMFKAFGESEASARMPFAIANILFIILFYLFLSKMFSRRMSIVVCFIIAFSPLFIQMSRECRSYTLHQLFYFLSATLFFIGFEYKENNKVIKMWQLVPRIETKYQINLLILLLSFISGYIAKSLQPLTYNLVFVIGGYALTMLTIGIFNRGRPNRSMTKYAVVLIAIGSGVLVQYIFNYEHFQKMLDWSTALPDWARFHEYSVHHYRWYLADQYPVIFYTYPLGIYLLIKNHQEKGIFFLLMFAIPFILHSLIYPLKSDRYIFYIVPYFFLGFGIVVDQIIIAFSGTLKKRSLNEKAIICLVLLPLAVFIIQPWFLTALNEPKNNKFPNWFSFDKNLKSDIQNSIVITTRPSEFLYYFDRKPDYAIVNSIPKKYSYGNDLIDNESKLMDALTSHDDIYMIAYRHHIDTKEFFSAGMKKIIEENMIEVNNEYEKSFIVLKKAINLKLSGVN